MLPLSLPAGFLVHAEAVLPYAKCSPTGSSAAVQQSVDRAGAALSGVQSCSDSGSVKKSHVPTLNATYSKTNWQNAISEYEKILQVEPRDLAILNTVGDIYARLGQNEKAIERFRKPSPSLMPPTASFRSKLLAGLQENYGKLDPDGLATMEKLAELTAKQGWSATPRSMLLQGPPRPTPQRANLRKLSRLLKQLVLFDPENVQVITRTADLMNQSGQRDQLSRPDCFYAGLPPCSDPAQKILDRLIALDKTNLRAQGLLCPGLL